MKAGRMYTVKLFGLCVLLLLVIACSRNTALKDTLSIDYNSFPRKIPVPEPTAAQREQFNMAVPAYEISVVKENGKTYTGYVSGNREFLERIMQPLIEPYLEELGTYHPVEIINTLTLFSHEIYRVYFGRDSFRWGGDLLDLEDPLDDGIRHQYRYGVDCSGFATLPYELAVYLNLFEPESESAVYSSKGFKQYCERHGIRDKGGREGTSNNFRVDTPEIAMLGRHIYTVEQGGKPTAEQVRLLQAGDLVGRSGHFGIIVEILGEPYYLESGGWVVPPRGGLPYPAGKAIEIFSQNGPVMVRRSLPDYRKR